MLVLKVCLLLTAVIYCRAFNFEREQHDDDDEDLFEEMKRPAFGGGYLFSSSRPSRLSAYSPWMSKTPFRQESIKQGSRRRVERPSRNLLPMESPIIEEKRPFGGGVFSSKPSLHRPAGVQGFPFRISRQKRHAFPPSSTNHHSGSPDFPGSHHRYFNFPSDKYEMRENAERLEHRYPISDFPDGASEEEILFQRLREAELEELSEELEERERMRNQEDELEEMEKNKMDERKRISKRPFGSQSYRWDIKPSRFPVHKF